MKILRMTILTAGLALIAFSARASESKHDGFGELTVDQVAELIAKNEVDVFDNNGKDVFRDGHVPTAKWVPFNEVKESDLPKDRSRKLVFYCANPH